MSGNAKQVLAAIDPKPTTERSVKLNQQILNMAYQIVQSGGGRLDVLHSWHLPGECTMAFGRTKVSQDKHQRMRDMAEA